MLPTVLTSVLTQGPFAVVGSSWSSTFGSASANANGMVVSAMADTALKSFVLLFATICITNLLRNRSAATLHHVWTLTFCGMIVVPCISPLLPAWRLSILPAAYLRERDESIESVPAANALMDQFHGQMTGSTTLIGDSSSAPKPQPAIRNEIAGSVTAESLMAHSAAVASPVSGAVSSSMTTAFERNDSHLQQKSSKNGAAHLFIAWLIGVAFCLLRILRDQVQIIQLLRHGRSVRDESWNDAKASAARALDFRGEIELRQISELLSPMITGMLRPVIVISADSSNWDQKHRRLVLLHEVAHAKRRDVLIQMIAQLACALYWFNPLAWYGLAQLRKYRELACDDLVLESGQRASDYADVLLDVARACRHRSLSTAIGMARCSDLERRITAVLDRVRSHVSLSKRTARSLLALSALFVILIGSMRLQSHADQAATADKSGQATSPAKTDTAAASADAVEFRQMTIHTRDAIGSPIAGAKIQVSVWEVDNKKSFKANLDYTTSKDGSVVIKLPMKFYILRLWASRPKFVPMFVNFHSDNSPTSDISSIVPAAFDFVLPMGNRVTGKVIDEDGRPIPGVKVRLKSKSIGVHAENPATPTIPEARRVDADDPAVTDENGNWVIETVRAKTPDDDFDFELQLRHDDYISDLHYGELQQEQGITTAMLISGDSQIVMKRGARISGTVVDSSGHPIKKGIVVWHDRPYFSVGDHEVALNENGEFRSTVVPPGEYPVTVVATGFMPERQMIRVSNELEQQRFVLQPGKRITLRIVDQNGKPIPQAGVQIKSWRGFESLYNHKHPNVLDSGIPIRSDEQGVFVWEGAPEDAVTYSISANFGSKYAVEEVSLVPQESEHVVTLSQPLSFSGRVTDSSTGDPIPEFRAIPVVVFRPNFLSTNYSQARIGRAGQYEIENSHYTENDYSFHVRIEADGYRTAISEKTFRRADGQVNIDFSLNRTPALQGQVIDSSGRPVAGAVVIQGTPSAVPMMRDGFPQGFLGDPTVVSDADGRFHVAASFEPSRIRVLHPDGFAEVLRQIDEPPGIIALQSWAKVSGTLQQSGVPVRKEGVSFFPVKLHDLGEPRFQDSFHATTDPNGHFEFERLPPIAGGVKAYLGPWKESQLTSSQSVPLELKPGEQRIVSLGGKGTSVTGKVAATGRDNTEFNKNWSLNYLIRRDSGITLPGDFPPLSFDPQSSVQPSWSLDQHFHEWIATRDHYFVKLSPDGDINITGVPAGEYDLLLQLYEQPAGCLIETVGQRVVPVVVTETDITNGKKDIGRIEVECRIGPRVGQNMQVYKFIDINGRQRTVSDMKGQYVLLHVWASWCAPCLEKMPRIQATLGKSSEKKLTFVGLNLDEDPQRAKDLVAKNKWDWSQNYLGSRSDMARQLAISSVPTYYLINRDGLLVTSTIEWSVMESKIDSLRD